MAILETISQLPFSSLLSQKKEVHYHATVSSKGQHVEKIANISYVLESCKNVAELKQVHASIFKCGGKQNIFLATKLIHLYSMFGSVDDACLLFNKMQNPDSFLWNTVIRACASNGLFQETLLMYKQMQCAGVKPDKFTFPFVIKACTGLLDLKEGSEIHELVLKNGLDSDFNAASGLINMYAKCGSIFDARKVFDKMTERNLVLWATMIAGYVEVGDGYAALELFHEMNLKEIGLDCGCILGGLRACGLIRALFEGKSIHAWIIRTGFESDLLVRAALVDMYVKCEILNVAHQLFDKMPNRNVAMWASMIAACVQSGYAKDAVEIFCEMQQAGMKPNAIILATVIPAFAHFGSLEQGKCIHAYAIRSGFESNTRIATAFIGMYAKCGSVEIARKVFDKISERDVVSWTAMIAGYGMHGHGEHALAVFNEMQEAGVKPDHVTFVSVLSACSRAGLLDKGWRCFDHMTRKFNIQPTVKHYACMVDLLGRAGRLVEAYKFIRKMQLEPYASVWGALLGACAIHCNVELAEHVAEHLYNLEPKNPSWYVLLSNVYAAAGRSDGQIKVTRMMESQGLRKLPGKR